MTDRVAAETFPPGEFLRDELEERGWTQGEFAEIIQRPARLISEIISAKRSVTPETAKAFAAALGTSAQFWLNLETSYQLSRAAPVSTDIRQAAVLHERFPIREMIKRRWIEPSENVAVLEKRVCDFFAISNIHEEVGFTHAARKKNYEHKADLQLAWLYRVRHLASALHTTKPYSKAALNNALAQMERLLTEPEEIRHVPRMLSEAGVRFVVVEAIPGSAIEGVCFWIDNGHSPVVALSLKYGRIDNVWFNIIHELDHVLNDEGKESPVIDESDTLSEKGNVSDQERRANAVAANFCVPEEKMRDFIARLDPMYSTKSFLGFSRIVQRHPGLVAGQLQRRTGRWELFRKYQVDIREHLIGSTLTDGFGQETPVAL